MKYRLLILFLCISSSAFAQIRVMSYNIRYGEAKDGINSWEKRCVSTPAMIYDVRPEVFGVQEALTDQLEYVLKMCPIYKEVGVGREDGADGGEHMSVFYNTDSLKLITWGNYWLSETPDRPSMGWDAKHKRTATWLLLEKKSSGKRFYFVNTHLDHRGREARVKGIRMIYDNIQLMNKENYPMVLTGDFNILPDDECLVDINKLMKSARFNAVNADKSGSFNGWGKYGESKGAPTLDKKPKKALLPIDYIYYSGFKGCSTFRVVTQSYAGVPYISDHYPIFADLEF